MGCINSTTADREAKIRSKAIEKTLKQDGDKSQKEFKLLLLGKNMKVKNKFISSSRYNLLIK